MEAQEIAKFRRRIGDKLKSDSDVITVSQADSQFNLRFTNITNAQVWVNDVVVEPEFYTVDSPSGTITFQTPLEAGQELRVDYSYAAYTDIEIEDYVDAYGFDGAIIEVLTELLTDSARMYDYSEGATTAKLSQVFDHLKGLLEFYQEQAAKNEEGYTAPDGTNYGSVTIGRRTSSYDPNRRKTRNDKDDLSRLII